MPSLSSTTATRDVAVFERRTLNDQKGQIIEVPPGTTMFGDWEELDDIRLLGVQRGSGAIMAYTSGKYVSKAYYGF